MRLYRLWCAKPQLDDVGTCLVTLKVRCEDSLMRSNGSRCWAWHTRKQLEKAVDLHGGDDGLAV